MPGDEPKGQHIVHRDYLDGFVDPSLSPDEQLWAYMPNKKPFKQTPAKIARRHYYYCHEEDGKRLFTGEFGLSQLETIASPILKRIRNREFDVSADDRLSFAGYIATAHCRVPTFERKLNRMYAYIHAKEYERVIQDPIALERIAARLSAEGEETTAQSLKAGLTAGAVVVEQENRGWSMQQMFKTMLLLQEIINKMYWSYFLAADDNDGFLTTDNPVSVFDPASKFDAQGDVGFAGSPYAHFLFPICQTVCLLGTHNPRMNIQCSAHQVRQTNSLMIGRADTQVYAPFKSDGVQRLLDKHFAAARPRRVLLKKGKAVLENATSRDIQE